MDLPHVLTIAGSDSGGGAGIQADLKTFSAHQTFGLSVITAVTAQNTRTVTRVLNLPPDMVTAQIDTVFSDIRIDAVKIGMLSTPDIITAVADALARWRPPIVVLDPVMVSKSGCYLLQPEAVATLRSRLLPLATLITPNLPEAELLGGRSPITSRHEMTAAAQAILNLGATAVLLKGGHCHDHADDLLLDPSGHRWLPGERLPQPNTHGTGCTLSSAITAQLASGQPLADACQLAKAYVRRAIAANLAIGGGCGPLHHFVDWY